MCNRKCSLTEILPRGRCSYSAQTENHLKFIVGNAMFQPIFGNTISTYGGVNGLQGYRLLGLEKSK